MYEWLIDMDNGEGIDYGLEGWAGWSGAKGKKLGQL